MSTTPAMTIYESTFAKSDKTDVILVVDGHKLHVNKAYLSFHSDFFDKIFNSKFVEKSMTEIPIQDVNFEEFATLLSIVHFKPITPTKENAEKLLELADRFLLPGAKPYLEMFLISTDIERLEKLRIGDKYGLDNLVNHGISLYTKQNKTRFTGKTQEYKNLSDKTKIKFLENLVRIYQ